MAEQDRHFIHSVYQLLSLLDLNPSRIATNIKHESADEAIMFGMPDTKVGFYSEGMRPEAFVEDGWYLLPLSILQLQTLHAIFSSLETAAFEDKRRLTMNTVKQTSQHEQWLIDAVIRRGIPVPDRNHRLARENGSELTTPDLAWVDVKMAFFVDGLWWHTSKDDHDLIKALQEDDGTKKGIIMDTNKSRQERDSRIRSQMQAEGWKVLSCSDRDLENHKGIEAQVDMIEQVLKLATRERAILAEVESRNSDGNPQVDLMDLL